MFAVGPSGLELHESPDATDYGAFATGSTPTPDEHFALLVSDVAKVYSELKGSGVPFGGPPQVQPLDHAYMQRSLLEFSDPDGFRVQISQPVDRRLRWTSRLQAKGACRADNGPVGLYAGFCHFNFPCLDIRATREFYGQALGLAEISYRNIEGSVVESVYAVGCTELEIGWSPDLHTLRPWMVSRLGFWTDDVDHVYHMLKEKGIALDDSPVEWVPLPGIRRRAFAFQDPDGRMLQVAQCLDQP
jgi:catechol 2,3-dioxygenase-like lactoylglutathione lyase family enzyme